MEIIKEYDNVFDELIDRGYFEQATYEKSYYLKRELNFI